MPFDSTKDLIDAFAAGKMVILVDDEDRENEGDLVMAAELCTPESINFMAKHGRGLICLSLTEARIAQLDLPMMVDESAAKRSTAFTISIEAREGVTTGISAADRTPSPLPSRPTQARVIWSARATCSRSRPNPAASSNAPATPKDPSTSRGWPASIPRE